MESQFPDAKHFMELLQRGRGSFPINLSTTQQKRSIGPRHVSISLFFSVEKTKFISINEDEGEKVEPILL